MTDCHVKPVAGPRASMACLLVLIWVVAGLSGCGGGDGSASTPPPAPQPAFALSSTLPADAASGVARDATIAATFNTALDLASVSTTNVTLVGPGNNQIPLTVVVNGARVEAKSKAGALPSDTTYTLTLAAAIKDSAGRSLSQPVTRTFSTASAKWSSEAGDLAPRADGTTGMRPIVHTDAAGRTTAAWLDRTGLWDYAIYAARLDRINGSWGEPTAVAKVSLVGQPSIGLAEGPEGDMFLTWIHKRGDSASPSVHLSRYLLSSNRWSPPIDVAASHFDDFGVREAVPISDAAGNLTLLYSNGSRTYATRLDAMTGVWTEPRRIEYQRLSNYIYRMGAAADGQGNIVAAWIQDDQNDQRAIYAARYDVATGLWAEAQRVAGATPGGGEPFSLVLDRTGVATIAWAVNDFFEGTTTIWASRLAPQDKAWSGANQVNRPADGRTAGGVKLVVDSAGTVTAVWSQGSKGLRTARWGRGNAGWSDYGDIAPNATAVDVWADCLLADSAGNLLLVGATVQQVYATRYLATTSQWQSPVMISAPSGGTAVSVGTPAVSMDSAGDVVALWFAQYQLPTEQRQVLSFNRLR